MIHTVLHKTCECKMITDKILVMKDMKASSKALLYCLLNFIGQLILSLQASTEASQTGMPCMMNSAEFFAEHSQKNLVQLSL